MRQTVAQKPIRSVTIQAVLTSARPNFAPLQKLRLNCVLMCEQKRNPIWRRKEQSWETCMVNSRGTRSLLRLTTKTTLRSRPLFFTLFALNVISTGIDRLLRSRSWKRRWHARLGSLLFYDWFSTVNKQLFRNLKCVIDFKTKKKKLWNTSQQIERSRLIYRFLKSRQFASSFNRIEGKSKCYMLYILYCVFRRCDVQKRITTKEQCL